MNTTHWICIPPVVVSGTECTCWCGILICMGAGYKYSGKSLVICV